MNINPYRKEYIMGKVKQWAMDNAENFLSNLESQIKSGAQTVTSAMLLVKSADIAWDLIGFNHIDEVEEYLEDVADGLVDA